MNEFWQTLGGVIMLAAGYIAGVYVAHDNATIHGAKMHYLGKVECSKNDFGTIECRELNNGDD